MFTQVTPIVAVVAALIVSAALPAAAEEPTAAQIGGTYNWLHPKLGIVKVDRATGAMVRSQCAASQATQPEGSPAQTKYWLDPKGNYRVIKAPPSESREGAPAKATD